MAFLPNFPGMGAQNELAESRNLNLVCRHVEIHPDGRKITKEKSYDEINENICKGSDWLISKGSAWDGKRDRPEDHQRNDRRIIFTRETTTIENPDGSKIIDEIAGKKEDLLSIKGTKLISDLPERDVDTRDYSILKFLTPNSSLTLLSSGNNFIPLLED
jgi:hypothetical protein